MADFQSPDQTKHLVDALRALITPGVYAAELESSPLIGLPAVIARAGADAPRTTRAQVFIQVLETVINTRLSKTDRDAARILFAVGDWSGKPMRERHYEVAKLRNRHWTWERNYRKEPLNRDLTAVLRALLREGDVAGLGSKSPATTTPDASGQARAEADYHLRLLGRQRTALPLDMSLHQLVDADLIVQVKLDQYHERQTSRHPGRRVSGLDEVVRRLADGQSVLLLGEPGAGKTLALYQLAIACERAGLTSVPVRARDVADVLAREGWRHIQAADPASIVVLLDGLDEVFDLAVHDGQRFAADLRELLGVGPYVVSSRVREYEELVSGGFRDPGFDVVYMIEPWTLEHDFHDYVERLARAGKLSEPSLYEAVVSSEHLARLIRRPLYARMLTFVGEATARGLRDHVTLYSEYLAKLSRITDNSLENQGLRGDGALSLWQSAAWIIYASGGLAGEVISLSDVEQRLPGSLPRPIVKRILDQIIDRSSSHGRETGEFIHYSFYEYLVAREVCDRMLRDPGPVQIIDLLKGDLPREVRHYLIGQLRVTRDANLRDSLLRAYASVRVLDILERDRLLVCNLLIYLISRVTDSSDEWLRAQLADEPTIFLRHAMLWAMCHLGSSWALRRFFDALEADPQMRSECRGYTLYYYGDLSREDGPPYRDDNPLATECQLTYRRVMTMFAQPDFAATVLPERRFIDLYTFLDILVTHGITVVATDEKVIRRVIEGIRATDVPDTLLGRLVQMASRAGYVE